MSNTLFNDGWLFNEFPIGTDFSKMENSDSFYPVEIPHDWMIYHVNDLYKDSVGFYKKTFLLSKKTNHTYLLRFEGVYMNSEIFCNGQKVMEWKYGYSTFDADLTSFLRDGQNTVYVVVTYQSPNSRWYSGAGIYRKVLFIDKDDAFFPLDGIYLSSKKSDKGFTINFDIEALSKIPGNYTLKNYLIDKDDNSTLLGVETVSLANNVQTFSFSYDINNVQCWDITHPYLYTIQTILFYGDLEKDFFETKYGFKTVFFDPNKGFFLNGRNVKINGACMHHDLGALGAAMNRSALKRQFQMLLDMGVNSIRTSHNMPAVEVMDLADEMGILVYSESFDMWELPKTEHDYGVYFKEWWEKDVTSWVRRDRNRASLFILGIGNEIYDTHAGNGLKWTKLLRDKVRELDYRHNAYIAIGSNYIAWENAQKCSDLLELSGYNYGERLYDEHHKKYPNWVIFGSETASTVQSRGIYHFPFETRLLTYEDGQCSSLGNCTTNWGSKSVPSVVRDHKDRDFIFGQYIWTGWDYIGEPTPYHSKNSYFGQIDTAGFKKDTYYHYQAEWTNMETAPMVHLLPYWDFNEGQIIDVCAYSNAPYVELFFNDNSLGKQFIDHKNSKELQGHWKLPYAPGKLFVKAYDYDGNTVATDYASSFSDPASINLIPEKTTINADNEDLCFIDISLKDTNGNFVANARNRVEISVSGPGRLIGLDNGDSTDYEEYKGTSRKLFSGKLLAIIAPTNEPGTITVTASSKGIPDASIEIEVASVLGESLYSCRSKNNRSPQQNDIPIRKIELSKPETTHLNKETKTLCINYNLYPEDCTYKEVSFKALTKDAVPANYVRVTKKDHSAILEALGDGEFTLTAFANNDKDHPEVISTLDFDITGLGPATHNPYSMVPGVLFTKSHSPETALSFLGGVFLPCSKDNLAFVTYENVDFGNIGSSEIHIPIFSFKDSMPIQIWEGDFNSETLLFSGEYKAKSIYNTYQENVFRLSKKLKGITSITISFTADDRFSMQGFYFTKPKKAYSVIEATSFDEIVGDSFTVNTDSITHIGNNVSIAYKDMIFDEGVSSLRIIGRSNNEKSSLHVLFVEEEVIRREMFDIPFSDDYQEYNFNIPNIQTKGSINLVFLPGSNFDLKEFEFTKAKEN